jgi:hypothetical protein
MAVTTSLEEVEIILGHTLQGYTCNIAPGYQLTVKSVTPDGTELPPVLQH